MDTMNNMKNKISENTEEMAKKAGEQAIESGKDWLCYVQEHPLQSVLFALVGYFALKGLLKS